MISPEKIDEWIQEVEQRPLSAALIIRYIANRLSELAEREEQLSAENIELLSGRKVEEYENRIANLEYQLDLLKRQLGGEVVLPSEVPVVKQLPDLFNLLLYHPLGQVMRVELDPAGLTSPQVVAKVTGELTPGGLPPSILAVPAQEELLLVFDSGRAVAYPAAHLPLGEPEKLDWQHAFLEEPRVKEELAAIQPIARMPLYDACLQASRRGFVKKMKMSFFTAHVSEGFIGSGVKLQADKTCGLAFANPDDLFVMVSQEGWLFSMPAVRLPTAIEEVIRLGNTDHIVSTFTTGQKASILFITHNGKAVNRDAGWLDTANSFKSRGQSLLSSERREAGTRIVGAAAVNEADWAVFLLSDGSVNARRIRDVLAAGSLLPAQAKETVVSMSTFQLPENKE